MFKAKVVGGQRTAAGHKQKLWVGTREGERALPDSFTVDYKKFSELLTAWLADKQHRRHPDRKMLLKLRNDMDNFGDIGGFPAEFDGDPDVTYEAPNGKLAEHATFVHELVRGERGKGWLEVLRERPDGPYRTSPIFVTPKKTGGRPNGKWRFIHHLSWAPAGVGSVNDGCELGMKIEYECVDDYCKKIARLQEKGEVLLWKADLDAAYKQWPFEATHRRRMGFRWLDVDKKIPPEIAAGKREPRDDELVWYFINRLPFGWTKSVEHFHRVSRGIKNLHLWEGCPELEIKVPRAVHDTSTYVDDTGGLALKEWAEKSKARYLELCDLLKVPWSAKKDRLEGAIEATKEFLGILVDTIKGEQRISEDRIAVGLERLKELDGKSYVATRELRSLVGVLSFAARCCRHARTFLRRCWDLLGRSKGRWCRLDRGVQADLSFWKRFWKDYNGVHLTVEIGWTLAEDIGLFTDASLTGWGAVYDGQWMGGEWPDSARGLDINELELLTFVIAAKRFGPEWARRRIITTIDNQAAMWAINKGSTRNPVMMVLMRELFLTASRNGFEMKAKYLNTKLNVMADAISRGDLERFYAHAEETLGIERTTWRQVEADDNDVERLIARMQKARRAEARRQREGTRTQGGLL